MTSSTSSRTFRKPSTATLAPLGGRPIAIRWLSEPTGDSLDVPPDVDLAASYGGVVLDDGRIVLTPTGEPLERVEVDAKRPTKKAASTSGTGRSTQAVAKAQGRGSAPRKAPGARTSSRTTAASDRPSKTSGRRSQERS